MPTKDTLTIDGVVCYKDEDGIWKPLTQSEGYEDEAILAPLVKTGDILKRNGRCYDVIIADSNIFVICRVKWSNRERSYITKYNRPEVYANQREINTLEELGFEKI
jgi:hypothetical protein